MRIIRRYYSIISPLSMSSHDTGVFPAVQYPSASKKPVSHQRLQSGGSLRSQSSLRLTASSTGSSSASEPPCLLQKVRMIRVIRLHKLTVPNGLMKCGGYGNQSGKRAPLPPRPQKEKTPPRGKVPSPGRSGNSPTSSSSHEYADIFLICSP